MSDNKMVTEREAVLRERKAYAEGAEWAWRTNYAEHTGAKFNHNGHVDRSAAFRYPLPSITRPRVVKDQEYPNYEWRVVDGSLEWRLHPYSSGWVPIETSHGFVGLYTVTKQRAAMWADLLNNPTEEVTE